MPGIYLQCDKCGATLEGYKVAERNLGLLDGNLLRKIALGLGWEVSPMYGNNVDYCPECKSKLNVGD